MTQRAITVLVAAFLALHLLFAHWRPICMWGIDLLAFNSAWVQVLFVCLGALLLVPALHQHLIGMLERLPLWDSTPSYVLAALLIALAGGLALTALPSAVHLLGDGGLLLRNLPLFEQGDTWKGVNAPLSYWLLNILYKSLRTDPESAIRLYSTLSGLAYFLIALPAARTLGRTPLERTLTMGFLLTPGFLQLFFGYVETYALLFPALLLYLLAGTRVLEGQWTLSIPALLLGILLALHFTLITLVPSLIVLVWLKTPRKAVQSAALLIAPVLALLVLTILGFDLSTYLKATKGTHLLPLLSEPGFWFPYRLITFDHLLDLLNLYLLVAPAALLVLCLPPGRSGRDPTRTFLLTATCFPALFTLFANPEIGAFRDWDAFAFPALPFTLWAARALPRRISEPDRLARAGLLICGAAALHTALWIGLNAREPASEARFTACLESCPLSPNARAYGWESLGIRHRRQNQIRRASEAYRKALDANPDNSRLWNTVGGMYSKLDQHQTAIQHYQKALQISPSYFRAYYNLAIAYYDLGRHEDAVQYFQKSITLEPNNPKPYFNTAGVLYNLGRHEDAVPYFLKAIDLNPRYTEAYFHLGKAYQDLNRIEAARPCFQNVLILAPNHPEAATLKRWLQSH